MTLTGKVRTTAERTEAVRLARTTTGVKNVVNKLVVDPTYKGVTNKDDKAKAEVKEDEDAKERQGDDQVGPSTRPRKRARMPRPTTKDVSKDAAQATKDAAVKTKDVTADASITSAVKTKLLGRSEGRRPEDRRRHQGQRRHADRHGEERRREGGSDPPREEHDRREVGRRQADDSAVA